MWLTNGSVTSSCEQGNTSGFIKYERSEWPLHFEDELLHEISANCKGYVWQMINDSMIMNSEMVGGRHSFQGTSSPCFTPWLLSSKRGRK
jgi:hypothetical protein